MVWVSLDDGGPVPTGVRLSVSPMGVRFELETHWSDAAFMRAINVGKRRVKMAELADHVAALGFTEVRTLIARGNVAFARALGVDATARRLDTVVKMQTLME